MYGKRDLTLSLRQTKRPLLETSDLVFRIWTVHETFYISIFIVFIELFFISWIIVLNLFLSFVLFIFCFIIMLFVRQYTITIMHVLNSLLGYKHSIIC